MTTIAHGWTIDDAGHCEIPSGVTEIGNHAFCGCTGLTSVTIPSSVTAIGNFAFYRCYGLPSVTIAYHTAIRVCGDWWQVGCKCARLNWWAGEKGNKFAKKNGYTEKEYRKAIEAMQSMALEVL